MAYEYESKLYANSVVHSMTENVFIETGETKEIKEVYRKAKVFEEVKQYALSKNKYFEDRKDTARSNKEFDYFNTLQIANRAIINKCKQLEDDQNGV